VSLSTDHDGRIDPGLYDEIHESLGETALVELVSLIGFYVIILLRAERGSTYRLPRASSPRGT
jgi:hypothetical protein